MELYLNWLLWHQLGNWILLAINFVQEDSSWYKMNLAHAAAAHAHRGLGGMGGPLAGMPTHSAYATTPSLHQRSPFAIQELLGLNQPQESRPVHHPHHPHPHQDSVISASSYLPRSLGGGGHTIQTACAPGSLTSQDLSAAAAAVHNPFSSWRPNFMSFPGAHAHPGNMLGLGGNQHHSMGPHSTDPSSGKSPFLQH